MPHKGNNKDDDDDNDNNNNNNIPTHACHVFLRVSSIVEISIKNFIAVCITSTRFPQ